ncbi:hypothetical protein GCM10023201_24250 [Actinomycetospora corticicola]|uniref:Tetratricopeptide repeat protein n=1 Tax=Actinomycetospora corticicola TaxID=663602 RepID=A0A7Y9DZZ5_9PSEU|nr:hypothetical protein [Actinomycetospora corticicola]NYD38719.1 hypothetical protein [Actinomycetospora corticicola]
MAADLERDLARRDVLRVATDLVGAANGVAVGAGLLSAWLRDEGVRAALRPVFEAALPDQRALIALGDVDVWLVDGRIARGWWEQAAAGPDRELAALGAWRVAQAHLRGGRELQAVPFLHQADEGGVGGASLVLARSAIRRGQDVLAAGLLRRSGLQEAKLHLAEIRLRADQVDQADRELDWFEPPPWTPGDPDLSAWKRGIRGEILFRRGAFEAAEVHFDGALNAPGDDRTDRYRLRLAQIAIEVGDAVSAHHWLPPLARARGAVGREARLLLDQHEDFVAGGAPMPDAYRPRIGDED